MFMHAITQILEAVTMEIIRTLLENADVKFQLLMKKMRLLKFMMLVMK